MDMSLEEIENVIHTRFVRVEKKEKWVDREKNISKKKLRHKYLIKPHISDSECWLNYWNYDWLYRR